jgi:hypothetical protein
MFLRGVGGPRQHARLSREAVVIGTRHWWGRESSHGGDGSALKETEVENDVGGGGGGWRRIGVGRCNHSRGRYCLFQWKVGVAESDRSMGVPRNLTQRRGGTQQTPSH